MRKEGYRDRKDAPWWDDQRGAVHDDQGLHLGINDLEPLPKASGMLHQQGGSPHTFL